MVGLEASPKLQGSKWLTSRTKSMVWLTNCVRVNLLLHHPKYSNSPMSTNEYGIPHCAVAFWWYPYVMIYLDMDFSFDEAMDIDEVVKRSREVMRKARGGEAKPRSCWGVLIFHSAPSSCFQNHQSLEKSVFQYVCLQIRFDLIMIETKTFGLWLFLLAGHGYTEVQLLLRLATVARKCLRVCQLMYP